MWPELKNFSGFRLYYQINKIIFYLFFLIFTMSLLQYGFEQKKINRNNILQEDQISENENNSNKDVKKPRINDKTFKSKWLAEFS